MMFRKPRLRPTSDLQQTVVPRNSPKPRQSQQCFRKCQLMKHASAFLVLGLLMNSQAKADVVPTVRLDDHPTFGRVAFDFPRRVPFTTAIEAGKVTVSFTGPVRVPSSLAEARNVLSVTGRDNKADILIPPGARIRATRSGNRVLIDVLDAPKVRSDRPVAAAAPPAKSGRGGAKAVTAQLAGRQVPLPSPAASASTLPAPAVAPVPEAPRPEITAPAPPTQQVATASGPLSLVTAVVATNEPAILAPFPPSVGAAAFRRSLGAVVVFDERRPLDLAPLRNDPVFAQATVQLLPTATVLRLPLPASTNLQLHRVPEGWRVQVMPQPGAMKAFTPRLVPAGLELAAAEVGRAVTVPDDDGGQALLVGTLAPASGTGSGVAAPRRTPEFALAASWLGVVVEPLADRIRLQPGSEGFTLASLGGPLSASADESAAQADATALTRRFDFVSQPSDALLRRMQAQLDEVAAAPPRARMQHRLAAAQTMIALGLGVEAHALLAQAQADEPQSGDPDAGGLSAIAALLYGRLNEAAALDDPGLTGTDEISLWRAARAAMLSEGAAGAAEVMASTMPLLLSYPPALRDRLLPLAAETLALTGPVAPADALLAAFPEDPSLDLARAIRLQAKGEPEAALALYDGIVAGPDRLLRTRAASRATELRLETNQLTAAAAADALESQVFAWRGDARERLMRLRIAELRTKAGAWRRALDGLRDADALFPDHRAAIRARITDVFLAMLQPGSGRAVEALELVALTEDYAGFLPSGASGEAMAAVLADKLIALDLSQRAGPVLERLIRAAEPGPTRATIGARLASLRLDDGNPLGAVAALAESSAPDLSPPILELRTLTLARARAAQGDVAAALATLATIDTASADDLRAELLGAAKDWRGSLAALSALAAKIVPTSGALSDAQQHVLLRQASAAAQAGDIAQLRRLREREGARMSAGAKADMFRLLTNEPVRGVGDLPRASEEMALARALPARLRGL